MKFLALLLVAVLPFAGIAAEHASGFYITNVASLISPAKLATLGKRGANPRIQKAVAQMQAARLDGYRIDMIASNAVVVAGYTNVLLARLTRRSLTSNFDIANKLGVLTDAGLADMRRGQSPTIHGDLYNGEELSVDRVIPIAVAPELDNVVANLELLPLRLNSAKNDTIGEPQRKLAKELHKAGLITQARLDEILKR